MILLAPAFAGAPDRVGTTIPGGAAIRQVAMAQDGLWVAAHEENTDIVMLVDPWTFEASWFSTACSGSGGAAITTVTEGWEIYTGCDDGTIAVAFLGMDGSLTTEAWKVGAGTVTAVETDGTYVYAVLEDDGSASVHALAVGSGSAASGFGQFLSPTGVDDLVLVSGRLYVVHGSSDISWVDTATGSIASAQENLGGRTYHDGVGWGNTYVYLADESGGVVTFDPSTEFSIRLDDLGAAVTGVGIDPDETYLLVATEDELLAYGFSGGPGSVEGTVDAGGLGDMVFDGDYVYAVNAQDEVVVLTDRPWVTTELVEPATAASGTAITFAFTSDEAGDYTVLVGGGPGADGVQVASGSCSAGELVEVALTVDGAYAEGGNYLWAFVESGGRVGRDAAVVTVDNPPSQVALGDTDVDIGDETIYVSFDGIDDEDLAFYTVYVTGEPFTADEYPTGGPSFVGASEAAVGAPLEVTAEPGAPVEVYFTNLVNDTTYYVAVRATDANGAEGPMSDVISAVPEETYSASQLRGDPGGYCACGTSGGGAGGATLGALALGAVAALRRRRTTRVLVVPLLAVLLAPALAQAKDPDPPHFHGRLYGGPATLADPYVQEIFGEYNPLIRADYGLTTRFVELGFGAGYLGKKGYLRTESGEVSNEDDRLTLVPLTLSATLRLDFFDEQILVPAGGAGVDYWLWKERWWVEDEEEQDFKREGGKLGWHWNGGVWLLLDPIDRRAASELEAKTGINDSYLTFEYRQTYIFHDADTLDFSDREFLLGLKIDL